MAVAIGRKSENMYVENVHSQLRKGMLEYSIMLLLRVKPCYSSDIIDELEAQGKAIVIRPKAPMMVSRSEVDTQKLDALYREGLEYEI